MHMLQQEQYPEWEARFVCFYDGVLESFAVDLDCAPSIALLVFRTQDQASPSRWSRVTLRLSGVRSLRLQEGPRTTNRVIFGGLHVLFDDTQVGVEWELLDPPASLSELMTSECNVVADALEWDAQHL
jgi:hypothetical protein